ncbi:MAG: periplasmic sensor signal transduction histidine kinase [Polaromonas sp.]|nr:periplasmic sensor signal transduction histidine kinase [Polaromonas sp.]
MRVLSFARRLWPDTLFGRLALIFLVGLAAAHALSFWLVFLERGAAARAMMAAYLAQDVASSVAILERVPPSERASWLPKLARRNYELVLVAHGPAQAGQPDQPSPSPLAQQAAATLSRTLGPGYNVAVVRGADAASPFQFDFRLADGTAVAVRAVAPPVEVSPQLVAILSTQLLLMLLLTWLAVRLVTRPLRRLAEAADALGPGTPARPLSEQGPREVAQAARALNAIQQRIEAYLAERMQILAAVSHDLQTPLTRMRLRADLLDDTVLRDKLQHDLDAMQELVREGIAYARSAHSASEATVRVDLRALLDSMACDYADSGRLVSLAPGGGLAAVTRPLALRRIVGNLADNALKFAGQAELSLEPLGQNGFSIAVRDRGPGIPEAELGAVLQPFHRLENSRSRETGGAGLGLAIAQQLSLAVGGRLTLANRDGGGLEARLDVAA